MLRLGVNTLFYLPGEVGGSETYLLESLRALMRRADAPALVLFTNAENHAKLGTEFPHAERVPCGVAAANRVARILAEQFRLPYLVRQAEVDVLWSPGNTAPFRCVCPQVVTMHDMQYKRFPADVTWLAARTMDVLYPGAVRHSAAILAPTEFAKREIIEFTGADPAQVHVTLEGVDPGFRERQPEPRLAGEGPFLLCVAHTYPHKNVALLVRAFNRIAGGIPHRLVLVGKARRGEPAVAAALKNSGSGRIIRIQGMAIRDLAAWYQAADWFVFPSLYEGFGLPVLEAMGAGTPVLAAPEAAIPEIGGPAIRYANARNESTWADALREAIALPSEARARQVAAAKVRAAMFTWEASAAKLWQVLKQAADSHSLSS